MFRFVGSEGALSVTFTELTLTRQGVVSAPPQAVLHGYNSVRTFSEEQQQKFAEHLRDKPRAAESDSPADETYRVPRGYDERRDHFASFFNSMRTGAAVY